ncbi:MAG: hypothetical protein AB8U15_03430 [Rickettsiales endosymbiont of Dermacentor nuttalli]
MTEAKINVLVRPVKETFGLAQHIYIIGTDSKGEKKILRTGTEYDNIASMLTDNLKSVYTIHKEENEKLFPNDWKPENSIEVYTKRAEMRKYKLRWIQCGRN